MMKNTHAHTLESANGGQSGNAVAKVISVANLFFVLAASMDSSAQSDKSPTIRQQAQESIKFETIVPEVQTFFTDAQAVVVFSKSEKKEKFFDEGLKELEKKAYKAKNLKGLQKVTKDAGTFIGKFSGGRKVIENNGAKMRFTKKDFKNAEGQISQLQNEAEELNGLFDKPTAEVTANQNANKSAVDTSRFHNSKGKVTEIESNLDQKKKALDALKNDLVNEERTLGETSANLTSEKVKLENLKRSYSVFEAIPAKTAAEAAESEKIEDNMNATNGKIMDLETAFNNHSNAVDALNSQISKAEEEIKEDAKKYQAAITNINGEELAMYKKQQADNKALLDTSIKKMSIAIKEKNDVVMSLDTTLKEISSAIKNQTQNFSKDNQLVGKNAELETLQSKRAAAIKELTEVNKQLQQGAIQAQEYLKNSYAVQLKILSSSENYYNQAKSLITADTTDLRNQISKNKNEVIKLEAQKKNMKKGLDTLSIEDVAERTNKLLEIQVQITFTNNKIQQLESEFAQKNGELDAVNKELADINQVKEIVKSYDQLVEYIVKLSELLNNLQELKLQNNYTEREITLQESVYADLKKKSDNLQVEIKQLTSNLNDTTLSDQAELEIWKELKNKRQEANLIAAQIKALAISQELSKARMAQELNNIKTQNELVTQRIKQKEGREIRNYMANNTDNWSGNKYYDGSIIEPKILEENGIINITSLQEKVKE